MAQFTVYHSSLQSDNDVLNAAVRTTYTILEDLNQTLANMDLASQGRAVGLWQEQQNRWDASYADLAGRLQASATASDNVADVFLEGDDATARLMA
jgi:uncharacterized protein YukE